MTENNKFKNRIRKLKSEVSALFFAYKRKNIPLTVKIVAAIAGQWDANWRQSEKTARRNSNYLLMGIDYRHNHI